LAETNLLFSGYRSPARVLIDPSGVYVKPFLDTWYKIEQSPDEPVTTRWAWWGGWYVRFSSSLPRGGVLETRIAAGNPRRFLSALEAAGLPVDDRLGLRAMSSLRLFLLRWWPALLAAVWMAFGTAWILLRR
jgi:hypothetical protein